MLIANIYEMFHLVFPICVRPMRIFITIIHNAANRHTVDDIGVIAVTSQITPKFSEHGDFGSLIPM